MKKLLDQVLNEKEILENRDIIQYAMIQLRDYIVGILVTVLVGYKMKIVFQSVLFLILFIPLRMYAGGYHASSRFRCGMMSVILLLLSFTCIKYEILPGFLGIWMGGAEGGLLYFLIPEDGIYSLDAEEKMVYRKRGRKIILLEMLALFSFYLIDCQTLTLTTTVVFSLVLLLIVLQKIRKRWLAAAKAL